MNKIQKTLCVLAMFASTMWAFAAQWDRPAPSRHSIQSGDSYYLYNPDVEMFVNTEAVQLRLDSKGDLITFEKSNDTDWTMTGAIGFLYSSFGYVGCDGIKDDPNLDWYFEEQPSGSYRIRPSKNDPDFPWETYPDTWTGISDTTGVITPILQTNGGRIDWYLVAQDEYELLLGKIDLHHVMCELQGYGYDVSQLVDIYNSATDRATIDTAIAGIQETLLELRIANASDSHPADVTPKYMTNPSFTEGWVNDGHDIPGWTMEPAFFCGMNEFDVPGFYPDIKTIASWAPAAFADSKVYQKITGLQNGKYRISNYGIWIPHVGEESDPIEGGYIYAKVGDKLYKQTLPITGWYPGVANVEFECRNGEAEVGIMFEQTNVGQCVIIDFKLEYMGEQPASERLKLLCNNAIQLIQEGGFNAKYAEQLQKDIDLVNELIASGDEEAQEALFVSFENDIKEAQKNIEAYDALAEVVYKSLELTGKGGTQQIGDLADYLLENDIESNISILAYDNEQIAELIKELTLLNEKAEHSIIEAGEDVTYLLTNGKFDTTGGWVATLNNFNIDPAKHIMEQWWCDWKAEQVLENVSNGIYRLEVQGFKWCSWDWAQAETDWNNGDGSPTYGVTSYIRLNQDQTTIQNVFACGPTDIQEGYQSAEYFVPNSADVALKFFELGLYENVVETTVTDNTLKVEFDCSNSGFWNCFYNLRLTYVGSNNGEALRNLANAITTANEYLEKKMSGEVLKSIEKAVERGNYVLENKKSDYDDINDAAKEIIALFPVADESIRTFTLLSITLAQAEKVLADESLAATASGKELRALYDSVNADYTSEYPTFSNTDAEEAIKAMEELITKARIDKGMKAGDDITNIITNPSFENTFGNDEIVGGGTHTAPYGWSMLINGKECHFAQELYDAGINSWTAIEYNNYTTDGEYSYCLLSAPVPDTYLYQTIYGLPAGIYNVSVDLAVTCDGLSSHLTSQRLLVNGNAQYYGKQEYYIESKLDSLYPEEVSRTFAGYEEVNTNETGVVGDMGNMQTINVQVAINEGEELTLGVRTDNHGDATNRFIDPTYWNCEGSYKLDNFRLTCVSTDPNVIEAVSNTGADNTDAYNLMGIKVNPHTTHGIYILNGKKYMKR